MSHKGPIGGLPMPDMSDLPPCPVSGLEEYLALREGRLMGEVHHMWAAIVQSFRDREAAE